jgi:hypothetical protein
MTLYTSAVSAGASFSTNSAGLLNLTTGALQNVYYYAFSFGFCLADLPAITDFTALFERYRFDKVLVRLIPINNMSTTPATGGNGGLGGLLHTAIDFNDFGAVSASESGINTLRQRPSYQMQSILTTEPLTWEVTPRVAMPAYASGAFSSYVNAPAPWLDILSTGVEHYGMKWVFEAVDPTAAVSYFNFKMELEYRMSFTDVA